MTESTIPYDVFKHNKGTRVRGKRSGKIGTVDRIEEVATECIEPFILWDGEATPVRAREGLEVIL
jgi:hypothetical protein